MHGFAMLMSFSSLLAHPTGQWYEPQQLGEDGGGGRGEGGGGFSMIHPSASNMTSAWNQPFEKQKFEENIIADFSTINHTITSKLGSLNYSFIILLNITAEFHFLGIKTGKVTLKTKKFKNFPKNAKAG